MARTQTRPAAAGIASPFPPAPPADEAMLAEVLDDAQRTSAALSAVMELLHGCNPTHQVCAASLAALLDPIWAGMETLCGDLATASAHLPTH